MANPMKGEATFLDGEVTRKIVVDWGVLIEVEQDSGVPLLAPDLWMRLGFLGSLLRFGMHAAGGELISRKQAAEMIARVEGARDAMKAAFMAAMPQETGGEAGGSAEGNA